MSTKPKALLPCSSNSSVDFVPSHITPVHFLTP